MLETVNNCQSSDESEIKHFNWFSFFKFSILHINQSEFQKFSFMALISNWSMVTEKFFFFSKFPVHLDIKVFCTDFAQFEHSLNWAGTHQAVRCQPSLWRESIQNRRINYVVRFTGNTINIVWNDSANRTQTYAIKHSHIHSTNTSSGLYINMKHHKLNET